MEKEQPDLPDIQTTAPEFEIAIRRVGVSNVKLPFSVVVRDYEGQEKPPEMTSCLQGTVGEFDAHVFLPHTEKGTHMSRMPLTIQEVLNEADAFSLTTCREIARRMLGNLDSAESEVRVRFPYFIQKEAPVSKQLSFSHYNVEFEVHAEGTPNDFRFQTFITVHVVAKSLCPCSKEISDYGAHNQRSNITIRVQLGTVADRWVWLEELIEVAEDASSCAIWNVLKRPDEKWVTERAFENPKFVEDISRGAAAAIIREKNGKFLPVRAFRIRVQNEESIHQHDAYAEIKWDRERF